MAAHPGLVPGGPGDGRHRVARPRGGWHGERDGARRPRAGQPRVGRAASAARAHVPRLRPGAPGDGPERGGRRRGAGAGAGRRRARPRLGRRTLPRHAPRARRHPGPGAGVRPLRDGGGPAACSGAWTTASWRCWRRSTPCRGRRRGWAAPSPGARCATRWSAGRPTSSGRRRATRSPRWRRRWSGAVATCRPNATRCCCGATCGSATSSSTPSAGSRPCSTGTWPLSVRPRWTSAGTSASSP